MKKCLILLFSIIVFGCDNSTDSSSKKTIAPGIYEGIFVYNGANLKTQQVFTENKYTISIYVDCQIVLRIGSWSFDGETLTTPIESSQSRDYCNNPMVQDSPLIYTFLVRNLSATTFEMFWVGSAQNSAQWVKYKQI